MNGETECYSGAYMLKPHRIAIFLLGLALLGQGCPVPSAPPPSTEPATPIPQIVPMAEGFPDETKLAQNTDGVASFEVYTKEAFEAAQLEGKPVILFFYANWCPTCLAEEPIFQKKIAETTREVHAFRVNYKDTDTDTDEEALAKSFDIFLQHTLTYLNSDGSEQRRTIGTQGGNAIRQYIDELH